MLAAKRVLLVVDDDTNVCRALMRLLGRYFDDVVTASTSIDARSLLKKRNITHVICDYCLGKDQPLGIDLIPRWREEHPSIRHAVIFTGNDLDAVPQVLGVDKVVSKSTPPRALVATLDSV